MGKQVYTLTTGSFCTVQLCLLFIDGATGCFYLPSTLVRRMLDVRESASSSDLSSLALNEQLRRGAAGRIFILFSGTRSGFCPRLQSLQVIINDKWWWILSLQMVGKIPTAQQRKFPQLPWWSLEHYKWWEKFPQLNKENSHSSPASVNPASSSPSQLFIECQGGKIYANVAQKIHGEK